MALNANALVSLQEAKAELRLDTPEAQADVEVFINAASTWAEHLCGRPLKARALTLVLPGPYSPELIVDCYPIDITASITITVDGEAQTVWKLPADGDQEDFDVLVRQLVPGGDRDHFWRSGGWAGGSSANPDNVSLAYTGGLNPVPDTVKRACLLLVQKLSRDKVQQTYDVSQMGAGGQITFRGNPVPLEARRLLEPYTLVRVG